MKPKHIGIIPDGNRRWAKSKHLPKKMSYFVSGNYSHLSKLIDTARTEGIEVVSIWAFSTENWKRDKKEIKEIFSTIEKGLDRFSIEKVKNRYKINFIGRKENLPLKLKNKIEKLEKETKNYGGIQLVIGIDYGGRDEILRAVNKAIKKGKTLDEKDFNKYLDSYGIPDPELIIRTGEEKRLSGYMPFQSVYSEIIFTDILFPDFTSKDLIQCIREFESRKRRFGK